MIRLLTSRKLTSICRSISTSSMAPYSLKKKEYNLIENFDTNEYPKDEHVTTSRLQNIQSEKKTQSHIKTVSNMIMW